MLRNKHVTRFGHPYLRTGALYHITDLDGLEMATFDINIARIASGGYVPNPLDLINIQADIENARHTYENEINKLGIPEGIKTLISLGSKREIQRFAKTLTINENELFLLVHNYQQLGFSYKCKFPDFIPEHLQINDQDREGFHTGVIGKFTKKITSLLAFRKYIHVHLFQKDKEWHCFFYSYDDIDETGRNHWKEGPHLHYISHIWPQLTSNQVWERFDSRRGLASHGVHIRFIPFKFARPGFSDMKNGFTEDNMFPLDIDLINGRDPTPPAQLLTRGTLTFSINIPNSP